MYQDILSIIFTTFIYYYNKILKSKSLKFFIDCQFISPVIFQNLQYY